MTGSARQMPLFLEFSQYLRPSRREEKACESCHLKVRFRARPKFLYFDFENNPKRLRDFRGGERKQAGCFRRAHRAFYS